MTLVRFLARLFRTPSHADRFARFTRAVAVTSVALGTIALILALSVLGGYGKLMDETAERLGMPIVVKPLFEAELRDARPFVNRIAATESVTDIELLVQRQALLRAHGTVDGVLLVSLSAQRASRLAPLLVRGAMPVTNDGGTVCVGATLARRLSLSIGDTALLYVATGSDAVSSATPSMRPIVVGGIVQTGMAQHDATVVLVPTETLRSWLRLSEYQASAIGFRTSTKELQETAVNDLRYRLGPAMLVQTTREQYASMEAWIALQREPIPIVLGLITLVAMFAVVAALLIAATEKVRHIAILRTMGATTGTIVWLVLQQSLRVTATGAVWGSGLAYALLWLQHTFGIITLDGAVYFVSVLPVELSLLPLVTVSGIAVVLGVSASMAPIAIALRVRPAAVLQFR